MGEIGKEKGGKIWDILQISFEALIIKIESKKCKGILLDFYTWGENTPPNQTLLMYIFNVKKMRKYKHNVIISNLNPLLTPPSSVTLLSYIEKTLKELGFWGLFVFFYYLQFLSSSLS